MVGLGKIWEVKTQPVIPTMGNLVSAVCSIKNIGQTSSTFWVYGTYNGQVGINYVKVGIPPGTKFQWFICNCGFFDGNPINLHLAVGTGAITNPPDDVFDGVIESGKELHYLAGPDIPQINFTLTTKVDGNGAIQITPPFSPYAPGTKVKLFAVKQLGWLFEKWKEDATGTTNPIIITMDKNKKVTAVYKRIKK